jgi:hypothetical protein
MAQTEIIKLEPGESIAIKTPNGTLFLYVHLDSTHIHVYAESENITEVREDMLSRVYISVKG